MNAAAVAASLFAVVENMAAKSLPVDVKTSSAVAVAVAVAWSDCRPLS